MRKEIKSRPADRSASTPIVGKKIESLREIYDTTADVYYSSIARKRILLCFWIKIVIFRDYTFSHVIQ